MTETSLAVADSWLVDDGRVLGLALHRERFLAGVARTHGEVLVSADEFWNASMAAIPRDGQWFPRVELQERHGSTSFVLRVRSAPERSSSVVVATNPGADPRRRPTIKGPDLDAMLRLRTSVQPLGAGEAVILSPEGFLVEGAYSSLLWWEGNAIGVPSVELPRIDSVTAKTVAALATALDIPVIPRSITPAELDGLELWSMSALHGIRIVTAWVDGPRVAELPGRLAAWRARLDRLRAPMG